MRKLTLVWLFTCFMLIAPSTASAQLNLFQGNWANTDPATSGVTRLQISATPVRVHAWGQCQPTDCDQGTVDGFAYGPNVSSNLSSSAQAISAIFRTAFSESIFIIRSVRGGRLQADVYTRFTDSSGRTAYAATYFFARRRGPGGDTTRQDCLLYSPNNLRIENEGANGWLLTDGRSRMLVLDSRADAVRALALARRHTAHCFIGRDNRRPNRKDFIMEYWSGDSGLPTTIPREDCISYNPATLQIRDEGASGWLLTDGSSRMATLDNRADAEQALGVARGSSRQCFIGRGNSRPNRKDYIVQYWR
jgi:hypothetical protein